MNFKELNDWCLDLYEMKDSDLIGLGIKSDKISKVRNILKKGISDRCQLIIKSTEQNNHFINDIENDLKDLSRFGLKYPQSSIGKKDFDGK